MQDEDFDNNMEAAIAKIKLEKSLREKKLDSMKLKMDEERERDLYEFKIKASKY